METRETVTEKKTEIFEFEEMSRLAMDMTQKLVEYTDARISLEGSVSFRDPALCDALSLKLDEIGEPVEVEEKLYRETVSSLARKGKVVNEKIRGPWGELVAPLEVDFAEEKCLTAIKILREAGFRVVTTPVEGTFEPVLELGVMRYQGLDEIKRAIREVRGTSYQSSQV